MDTPLRRSRRLEGLKPESPENPTSVLRARRALVEFESNPEERREPGSPRSVRPPGLESPRHQPETSPESPSLREGAGLGSPREQPEPGPGSPQRQRDPGLELPQRQPESSPEFSRLQPQPSGESPKFSQDREEADSESPKSKEEPTPGSPRHQLQPSPGSLEPYPGRQAPGPEPSQPLQELTPQSPGSPRDQREPSKPPPPGQPERDGLGPKKREGSSAQAAASKKPKKEEIPKIPKGKPKSGRVWKDRSKKRFSQMVQDKPLRTSWQQKMKDRQERKQAKDFARHLQEEKERRRQEKKQRRAENLKRRLENERKAEIVQVVSVALLAGRDAASLNVVFQTPRHPCFTAPARAAIRNPAKLRRAKKQQLRSIEKRDTLAQLQEQPPRRPVAKV
ncbi:hypothetical protein DBR06_SOUSAS6910002 [Sousa chinensis]|nr:hypothetical protein DBR06_SOUSAS6910002 [Sousa chinensis]